LKKSLALNLISLAIISLAAVFLYGCAVSPYKRVSIKGVRIKAEFADYEAKRRQGLMFRQGIAEDEGMLFAYTQEGIYSFWMKNMRFPLDIIWINREKRVVDIYKNAQPCQETCPGMISNALAQFILEVKAGFVLKPQTPRK